MQANEGAYLANAYKRKIKPLLGQHQFAAVRQKQDIEIMTRRLIRMNLPKLIVRNPEFPQGSLINHCSAGTYAYGCTKDVRYCSYVRWKFTGIPNPGSGNGSKGQTGTPNMG
eukprot:4475837-Ditylum_brightwellii.AAC.1